MIHKKVFTNGELNAEHQLEYTHNLGTSDLAAKWYDENGVERSTFDLFQIIDDNNVTLSCNGAISGNHTLLLIYASAGESSTGRRLFELTTTDDPDDSLRVALGKASTPASNITMEDLKAWLLDELGFLKVTQNLADINNASAARGNLAVYSSAQVDAYLAQKATLYQAGSGSVLGVANTSIFKPTSNYHPACLRDIKNLGIKPLVIAQLSTAGTYTNEKFRNSDEIGSEPSGGRSGAGVYTLTHNYGSTNYMVIAMCVDETNKQVHVAEIDKGADSFTLHIYDLNSADDSTVDFIMFSFNAYTS